MDHGLAVAETQHALDLLAVLPGDAGDLGGTVLHQAARERAALAGDVDDVAATEIAALLTAWTASAEAEAR